MLRNEEGTGIVDRLSTLGCCNGGLAQLPPWLVYPLLGVLIGGFILWGELSGANHVPVEDDGEAEVFFWFLLICTCVLFYMMFVRLDKLSHKEERHRIYSRIPDSEPSHTKRHRFCVSAPWDSYQWAAGALLIAISEIFLGVVFPAFSGVELYFAYGWIGIFAVVWGTLLIFMCIDPSQGVSREEVDRQAEEQLRKPCCEPVAVGNELSQFDRLGSLTLWCKHSGCRRFYKGKYRKHCKACNKCVEGFDHHCPFLNQCIGSDNYFWFMAILTSYIALMFASIAAGLYILIKLRVAPESGTSQYASNVWGEDLFALFTSMLVIFPMPKLYFMIPLWMFHLKLCALSWWRGEFHGTYMFTRNYTTGELRGRASYLDERARHVLVRIVHLYHLDLQSSFVLWAKQTSLTNEAIYCRKAISDGWTAVCNSAAEQTMGVKFGMCGESSLGKLPPKLSVNDILSDRKKVPFPPQLSNRGDGTQGTENEPLLRSVAVDKDEEDMTTKPSDIPPHARPPPKKGQCLPDCRPVKDKGK